MCLVIKKLPSTKQDGRVVQCHKSLVLMANGVYCTPCYYGAVDKNGFLFPKKQSERKNFYFDTRIEGGFIHAHIRKKDTYWLDSEIYPSYAFGVAAYGLDDLVCRGLYIPDVDSTRSYEEKKQKIKLLKSYPSPSALLKAFPELVRIKKYL